MTKTPHDALFKAAFEKPDHAAGIFRSIVPASLSEAISWETVTHEPCSFIDPDLAELRSDLLFSVDLRGGRAFLYLLLEHQSTSDPDMPLRMLGYLLRIWERFRKENGPGPLPPIIPAVVCHVPGGWTAPRSLEEMLEPKPDAIPGLEALVPRFAILLEDLAHVSNEDIKARTLAVFPTLALWALRDARNAEELLENMVHFGSALAAAAKTPHGVQALAQLVRYIALVSDDMHFERFRAKIREYAPEAEAIAMTIAEQMIQKGREEGREQGREEGQRAMLLKLLTLKFGDLTAEQAAQVEAAGAADLERYLERTLTADSVAAVLGG